MSQVAIRDVRFGGTWTRSQALKNDLIYALVRASLACSSPLPRVLLRSFGRTLGSIAYACAGGLARENVSRALGEDDGIAYASFRRLGAHLGDLVAVLGGASFEPLPMKQEALETIEQARREGGVVFASAHLGPWERVAATLVSRGVPLTAVVRESYDPRIDRIQSTLRQRAGLTTIPRGDSRAPMRILRALREGAVLGMPMDLKMRAPSVTVPFFGIPTETVVGPARIAHRARVPIVVGSVEGPNLEITATRVHLGKTDIETTARLNAEIERRIRSIPEEWLWMHPRW